MNLGIIGSGGREHSLCYKLSKSNNINNIYCIPGNAGTREFATNIDADIKNFNQLYNIVKSYKIDFIVVGPEVPLVNGIVDFFEKKKIKIFGPSKQASRLEGSKIFLKNFCKKFKIPTAKYKEVKSLSQAKNFLKKLNLPVVVKSDGLAAGKGVTICYTKVKAIRDVKNILNGKFKSSKKVIIEEFLQGEEVSYFVITDGKNFKALGTAQDHKRIGEGDTGLNTGGMGAYSPAFIINKKVENKIINKIIKPTIKGMSVIKSTYKGILYAGLIIFKGEPKLIEYNIRLGDPECQVLMMRLKNDLFKLLYSSVNNKLKYSKIYWKKKYSITIVAANKGYPMSFKRNTVIKGIKKIRQNENKKLFHAGTTFNSKKEIIASGGRVINATVCSVSLKQARKIALDMLKKINWKNKYYRKDIGYKIIK